ncbi:ABC transporter substrate-binding protein [Bradyrhizobium guangzhouense]|uniref:ABC transporter substrate-binding protein n=1 Tax=Bradyrhizobium guangzhouense TaxID=1325095 RepID=UPI0010099C5D|nr:ABC transporter substrate-binding protein [Bradyrhizobium guangzhouense]RXH11391.1 hypothetical protein EAS54_29425 [Bradyrhizobium guangzhouense]
MKDTKNVIDAGISRRSVVLGSAALAAAGLVRSAEASDAPIRIGFNSSLTAGGVLAVADHFGWFKNAGLNVVGIPFTNAPAQAAALIGGSLDIAIVGANGATNVMADRASIVSLDNLLNDVFLIAENDGPISKIEDLKGKRIGYVEGTVSEILLFLALKRAGLNFSDVTATNLAPPGIVTAMIGRQIDAASIYLPFEGAIAARMSLRIIARPSTFEDFALPMYLMADKSFIRSRPADLTSLLEVKARANDWRKQNLELAAKIAAGYSQAPDPAPFIAQVAAETWLSSADILAGYTNGKFERWLDASQEIMSEAKIVKQRISAKTLLDLDADREALRKYLNK